MADQRSGQRISSKNASNGFPFKPKRILVPTDGSENATRAVSVAAQIAKKYGSELLILIVTRRHDLTTEVASSFQTSKQVLVEYYDQMDKRSNRMLEDAAAIAESIGCSNVKTEAVPEFDSVPKQILDQTISKKVDLIVIGTRGLGGFKKLLLGSVSSSVVTHGNCNVLVVR